MREKERQTKGTPATGEGLQQSLRQSRGKSLENKTRTKQRRALEKIPVAAATACASVRPPSDYYLLCCRQSNQINYKADRNHKPLQQQAIDEKRQSRERRDGRKKRRNQKNKR
jgi:hypothetical protein